MLSGPATVDAPEPLFRVERPEPPLHYSHVSAEVAGLDRAGNRFDVPGAGVLYAASTAQGAIAETTAQFRRSASLIERMAAAGAGADELQAPGIDADWRARRLLRSLRTRDALPFLDIEDPRSHTYLTENARSVLIGLGIETLDVPTVRGPSRLLTRGLATWAYRARDERGEPLYGGVRYLSKLGSQFECWAIFDGTATQALSERRLTIDDPDLTAVAAMFGIPLR